MAAAGKHSPSSDELQQPHSKRPKVASAGDLPKLALNRSDCNLDFTVEQDGLTGSALHGEGFAYCWSGARANVGVKEGRYCFGCKVVKNQSVKMEDTAKDQQKLCRLGISRGDDDVASLGESANSFGYGGSGKFSNNGSFFPYGGKFGVGDTIICAVDLESKPRARISFYKNGRSLGVAKEFDVGVKGLGITEVSGRSSYERALFPHVLLKNVKVRLLFSIDHGLMPVEGYKPWDAAVDDGNAVEGPKPLEMSNCEVIMMVGLPGAGKTTWAEKWAKEHPEKRYMLLGTNLALDQMKVPGLMRKGNYGERFDRLMDRASKIFNQLLARAANTPRNYILDQTNVYRTARVRKLKSFRGFHKIAVVIFPLPAELKKRTVARAKQMGKEVPADAVNEMLANFVLPKTKDALNSVEPFDEVWFPELQSDAAERHLLEMQRALPPKLPKNVSSTPTSSIPPKLPKNVSSTPISSIPPKLPKNVSSTPTSSVRGSFRGQNSREDSYASGYTSTYEDRNLREASYQSPYMPQDWNLREGPQIISPQGKFSNSYEIQDHNLREASYNSPYMSQEQNLRAGSEILPQGRLSSLYDYTSSLGNRYSRESSLPSYQSDYPSPYGQVPSVPYGAGAANTPQSTSLVGNYSGGHPRYPFSVPAQQLPISSHVGGGMPDMTYGRPGLSVDPYLNSGRSGHALPSLPLPRPGWGHSNYRY